jgi:GNAT superfamily N-acetyltransferase
VHDSDQGLQELAPGVAQPRRHVAAAALIGTLAVAGVAGAEPEPRALRPVVTRTGWQLDLTGYVQADAVAWSQAAVDELDPSTGQPLNDQRLLIRRGRLRAEAHRGALAAAIELDGNTQSGAVARLLGAQVSWTFAPADPPLVVITAGLFKIPFGAEVPASERDKPFLEAPTASRALFPGNYDAGAMAHGRYGLARWSVAIMNGAPVGDLQWRGKDPSASYDLVGRIGAEVAGPRRLRIEAGVSALSGTGLHPGAPPTKDDIQWVDDNQNGRVDPTEIQIVPGGPGMPSRPFSRGALGADLAVHWCVRALGAGAAFLEAAIATNLDRGVVYADPIATSRDLRQLGFALGVVQDVGPHVQLGARYDRYDADRDAMDQQGAELVNVRKVFSTLAVMASARWSGARIAVEYDHERNPFGRGDGGAPITRAADRLTVRAQVGF